MRRCVLVGVVVLCTALASFAYRPFDGTDAAAAERGVLEIELGRPVCSGSARIDSSSHPR